MNEQPPTQLYQYRPLESPDTVRIIVLHPAKDHNSSLECNIIHQDRLQILMETEDEHHYEAVSYTWGNQGFSHTISCDNRTTVMDITYNVDSLLRHFRADASVRYLWVDAICLNQADNDEKSIQVGIMGDIYRQARRTLVWLGGASPTEEIPLVFAFVKKLASIKNIAISKELVRDLTKDIFKQSESIVKVEHLLQRPWFQRRWIIQEVALGHDSIVQCGPFRMSWHWFVDGIEKLLMALNRGAIALEHNALDAVETACVISSHASELLTLLWDFHRCQCFDPRDRIFALYSLAEDVVPHVEVPGAATLLELTSLPRRKLFVVDYTSSWVSVYQSLALDCVAAGNWHVLLKHLFAFGALCEEEQNPAIPSWIPAWNKTRKFPNFMSTVPLTPVTTPFLQLPGENGNVRFQGRAEGRKIISTSNEWPPISEMRVDHDGDLDVFHLLAFGLAEGFLDLSLADQETKDEFAKELHMNGRPRTISWEGIAHILRESSRNQDGTKENIIVRSLCNMMKTYSLLKWEGNYIGLGRGDIRIDDMMIQPPDTNFNLFFIPTFCLRGIEETSLSSDKFLGDISREGKGAEERKWKITGPAFVMSASGLWTSKEVKGLMT